LEIFVKALSETVPVHRFQHLVRKRKFEEADEFAKRFQLDRQSVLKAKLIVLLQDEHPDQHLQEILGFLAEIQVGGISLFFSVTLFLSLTEWCVLLFLSVPQDDSFVLDVCLNTVVREFQSTKALLDFAAKVIGELENKTSTNVTLATVTDARRSASWLGTFHFLTQVKALEGAKVGFTGLAWQQFRQSDLVDVMASLARKGFTAAVELIWNREFMGKLFFFPPVPPLIWIFIFSFDRGGVHRRPAKDFG